MKSTSWSMILHGVTILCLCMIFYQLYKLEVKTTRTNKFILEALQDAKKGALNVVRPEDIVIGDPEAPGTIIMYSQPDCEYCDTFLIRRFPDIRSALLDTRKAKFILRFLTSTKDSVEVQHVMKAYCLGGDTYLQTLTTPEAALTYPAIDSCLATNSVRQYVYTSAALAREAGVRATPYFLVNGTVLTGTKNVSKFEALLNE